jgi:hypothetical protein
LASAEETKFKASDTAHSERLALEDAKAVTIPYMCLFSQDYGDPETVEEYEKILKREHYPYAPWMDIREGQPEG